MASDRLKTHAPLLSTSSFSLILVNQLLSGQEQPASLPRVAMCGMALDHKLKTSWGNGAVNYWAEIIVFVNSLTIFYCNFHFVCISGPILVVWSLKSYLATSQLFLSETTDWIADIYACVEFREFGYLCRIRICPFICFTRNFLTHSWERQFSEKLLVGLRIRSKNGESDLKRTVPVSLVFILYARTIWTCFHWKKSKSTGETHAIQFFRNTAIWRIWEEASISRFIGLFFSHEFFLFVLGIVKSSYLRRFSKLIFWKITDWIGALLWCSKNPRYVNSA